MTNPGINRGSSYEVAALPADLSYSDKNVKFKTQKDSDFQCPMTTCWTKILNSQIFDETMTRSFSFVYLLILTWVQPMDNISIRVSSMLVLSFLSLPFFSVLISSRYLHEVCLIKHINRKSWCLACTLKNLTCLFECEVLNKYGEMNIWTYMDYKEKNLISISPYLFIYLFSSLQPT